MLFEQIVGSQAKLVKKIQKASRAETPGTVMYSTNIYIYMFIYIYTYIYIFLFI